MRGLRFNDETEFRAWMRAKGLGSQLGNLPPEEREKKPGKWKNKRTFYDGFWFDSLSERDRYCELKLLEKGGLITGLEVHKVFTFHLNGAALWTYETDFTYTDCLTKKYEVEDVKNPANAKARDFIRNCKMMQALYGLTVRIVTR